MPKYYNFRQILDVYQDPGDNLCVGIAKSVRPPRRCKNRIASQDIWTAERLLDEMDRCKSLPASAKSLENLASLLLCKGVHNKSSKPHLSQVDEVSAKWRARVRSYGLIIKKERENERTEKALSDLKVMAKEMMAKLEENKPDEAQSFKLENSKQKEAYKVDETVLESFSRVKEDDPFVNYNKTILTSQQDLDVTSKPCQTALKTNISMPDLSSKQPTSISSGASITKINDYVLPSPPMHSPYLPSPPETPLALLARGTQQMREEGASKSPTKIADFATQRETLTVTKAEGSSSTKKTNFAVEFGSQDKNKFKDFKFELPGTLHSSSPKSSLETSTLKTTANDPSSSPPHGCPLPSFDFAQIAKSASPIVVSEEPAAAVDGESAKRGQKTPIFEFGIQYTTPSKSFDFDIPSKRSSYPTRLAERPSSIWDDSNICSQDLPSPDPVDRLNYEKVEGSPEPIGQIEQTTVSDAVAETLPIGLKQDSITANETPSIESLPPRTPIRRSSEEESFGYALITPPSSRYKTYLPARQQHGLLTPPETPETQRRIQNGGTPSMRNTSFFDSPVPEISRHASQTIARKPLPISKDSGPLDHATPQRAGSGLAPAVNVCSACGNDQELEGGDCPYCDVSENERVRAGCLHSVRLRRLRKLVERRIKAVTRRVSGGNESR